jgi:hypothetical protein
MDSIHTAATGVGEIFSLYGPQYRREHKLSPQHRKAMFAIEHCRTAVMGGHIDQCDHCGHVRISYNSCRNRHCPKCQGLNSIKWVDKLSANLLAVRYFHIVFTIPSQLNRLSLVNQKCLYNMLFKAASESLLMLAKDPKYLDALTGLVAVLHTWGQNLMEHPHLHTIVPAGGWDPMAQCWKHSRKKFFLPVKVISAVFKGKFLSLLKAAYNDGQLKLEGEIKPLQLKSNFKQLLNELYQIPWVVYAKKPFNNAQHIINYLGRYTHRVAIGNNRIIGIENDQVIFKWKDYKDRGSNKIMKLGATEFIRRFLLHVLPKGFCKIRYFGIFASRNRKLLFTRCRHATGHTSVHSKFTGLSWKQALLTACGIDLCLCPVCKTGKMQTVLLFENNKAPPGNALTNVL